MEEEFDWALWQRSKMEKRSAAGGCKDGRMMGMNQYW